MKLEISVVGAGGNGSFFLSHLARIIKGYSLDIRVTVFDGDKIENDRNLLRSPIFCGADLKRNKSDVICDRLNLLYGLDCFRSIPNFINTKNDETRGLLEFSVLVTCVDNMNLRKSIALQFQEYFSHPEYSSEPESEYVKYWLDCGNGRDFGQVFLGWNIENIPSSQWADFFKAKDDDGSRSCSIAPFEEQGPMINDLVAAGACLMLEPILLNKPPLFKSCYVGDYGMKFIPVGQ